MAGGSQHSISINLDIQPAPEWPRGGAVGIGAALAMARNLERDRLPFRAVNKRESPDYDPGLQRHHLLPRQLLQRRCFGPLFDLMGRERIGFEDFRSNGLLLPACDSAAMRIGLPMHRGPHHDYNALVIERVGQVEAGWSAMRLRAPEVALNEAVSRLRLLQRALRRRLLDPKRKRFTLNRHDPVGREKDFSDLDQMVDSLWGATDAVEVQPSVNLDEISLILRPAGPLPEGPVFRF
jgi:hypothetical protein